MVVPLSLDLLNKDEEALVDVGVLPLHKAVEEGYETPFRSSA